MAYPTDCISPQQVVDIANRDTNRLVGEVAFTVAKRSPYIGMMEGGTLENVSDTVRSVVGEAAVPAASMVRPNFILASQACGTGGGVDRVGTTEFQFNLKNFRGRGPKICVKTTRTAFKSSYPAAVNSLKQLMVRLNNADARANFLDNSGGKMVMDSTATFAQAYSGAINAVATAWPSRTPDSPVSHRALEVLMAHMRETLGVQPFEGEGSNGVFKAVFSIEQNQIFKDELGISQDVRALTTGRYAMGQQTIQGYDFEGPYRGIAHAYDPEPLRFTTITGGYPDLIEPTTAVATTTGYGSRPNDSWVAATGEIGFLFGQDSFMRLTPSYQQVAGWEFPNQLVNGGLQFVIPRDADCHLWGDYGVHLYEIERAFQPVVPHAVTAIMYSRCTANLGMTAC
jgi:hypothetical protein